MTVEQVLVAALAIAAWFFLFRYGKTSPAEAHRLVEAGARLVDVRTPGEFAGGHLPGAVNVPLAEIEGRMRELKGGDSPVVVYCASGIRSRQAKRILVRAGIAEVHDLGSMGRW
jgi:rhodanese-related sulfurtransferase